SLPLVPYTTLFRSSTQALPTSTGPTDQALTIAPHSLKQHLLKPESTCHVPQALSSAVAPKTACPTFRKAISSSGPIMVQAPAFTTSPCTSVTVRSPRHVTQNPESLLIRWITTSSTTHQ